MSATQLTGFAATDKELAAAVFGIRDVPINSAALAIKAGASAIVKAGAAFRTMINGSVVVTAINTDMPALVGTVAADAFNVFAFFINSAGTLRTAMGTAGATASAVVFPAKVAGEALIGYVSINPTGTGDFVGGTTALDDATVVPTAVYVNNVGPMIPALAL